jgi:hypothetical protein
MKKIVLLALIVFVVVLSGGILLENIFPSISSFASEIIMGFSAAITVFLFNLLSEKSKK